MSEFSRSPRIPAAIRAGDMLVGPDSVRLVFEGSVACGYGDCDWEMTGGTFEEQGDALRTHTAAEHGRVGR